MTGDKEDRRTADQWSCFCEPLSQRAYSAVRNCRRVGVHTLAELSAIKPATRDEMLAVSGIGEVKLERYAEAFCG